MGEDSIQVSLDVLRQFATGVAGGPDGGSGMSHDFQGSDIGLQGDLMRNAVMASFEGGGLAEGRAFAQAHMGVVSALGRFLSDAGMGLFALGQGAESVRAEYLDGDAEASAVTESVYRTFAPSADMAIERQGEQRQRAKNGFLERQIEQGFIGEVTILVTHGSAGLERARALQERNAAVEAQDDASDAEHRSEFDEEVQERVEEIEEGSASESDGTALGDLGRGTAGTPIPNEDGEIVEWIPYDNERVADTPPQLFDGPPPTPGG